MNLKNVALVFIILLNIKCLSLVDLFLKENKLPINFKEVEGNFKNISKLFSEM